MRLTQPQWQQTTFDFRVWTLGMTTLVSLLAVSSTSKLRVPGNIMEIIPENWFSTDEHSNCSQTKSGCSTSLNHSIFSENQKMNFHRDGFLVASDLLSAEIDDLVSAGKQYVDQAKKSKAYFSSIGMGVVIQAVESTDDVITSAFRRVALDSVLPQAAAELMDLDYRKSTVRLLRDIFMSKAVDQDSTCDWHVDDVSFWPESFVSEKEGINVWIAMQDMPASYQGSMGLAPGSHTADWRWEAYNAIGQDRSHHGGFTREEMKIRAESGKQLLNTCEMRSQAPELSSMIDETVFVPDLKKGDVIFMTRSLFHRTMAVTTEGRGAFANLGIEYLNRYSIRYVPGSARLPKGWAFEWGIMANQQNAGRSLDEAMDHDDLLWYPQVWPRVDNDRDARLDTLATTKFSEIKAKTRAEVFELISLFSNANKE